MDLDARKHVFDGLQTTKGQSLRIHTVLSAPLLFTDILESIISRLHPSKISIFLAMVVSVAKQAGLNRNLSENPKTGFFVTWALYN